MHELSEQRARRLLRTYAAGGRPALEAAAPNVEWPVAFPERAEVERIEGRGQAVLVQLRPGGDGPSGWWLWQFVGARVVEVRAVADEATAEAALGQAPAASEGGSRLALRELASDGVLRVLVGGELDFGTGDELRERLGDRITVERRVDLDLSEVTFIDAAGLHAVVDVVKAAAARGIDVVVVRSSRAVVRLAELVDEDGLLPPSA